MIDWLKSKTVLPLTVVLLVLCSGFFYGFAAHKYRLPPHSLIRSTFDTLIEFPAVRSLWFTLREPFVEADPALRYWPDRNSKNEGHAPIDGLGYFRGYETATDTVGVRVLRPERVGDGVNLVISAHRPEAYLMDKNGTILHRWHTSWARAFPDETPYYRPGREKTTFWRRARVMPDGTLVAIFQGQGIVKLDRESTVVWSRFLQTQNDLEVLDDGTVYTITKTYHSVPWITGSGKVEEYFLTVLERDGRVRRRISLLKALDRSNYNSSLRQGLRQGPNVFHTNTVHVLGNVPEGLPPGFEPGNVLLSFPRLNAIGVLDMDEEIFSWLMAGMFQYQHNPRLLENGNLLVFDNLGHHGYTRVIEFNPLTQAITWRYNGNETNGFRSRCCGVSQRLTNGNTLITDSTGGRAFEVTPDGEVVWSYVNPNTAGPGNRYVATLFQVQRMPRSYFGKWF